MSNDYGEGVSRVLDPTFTQFLSVIWQAGLPPLDSEFNLSGDLAALLSQQQVLRGTSSGWLGDDTNPSKVYATDPTWSNWFQFGRQRATDKQSIMWANVNGWLIAVSGTQTGLPPGSPNDQDTFNRILLDPSPNSAGDARCDFIFLEVWRARIAPYPSTLNKPNASALYKLGNVEGGFSYLPDDLMDPAIGEETTERVQLQSRIRVVKGLINLSTNPDGFDQTVVKSQAAQATPPSVGGYAFTNMREELGDPGLWRSGDGNPGNSLGTVDGYCYAIPIAAVFRRNSILWTSDPSPNLNGGFNRNPTAVDRTGTLTFSTVPTLAADLSASATSLTLVSATNIPLPASSSTPIYIQIGDEILTYQGTPAISGTTVSGLARGISGTVAEVHKAGATIRVLSSRPDGLFSDQVASTDILDLRHVVKPAWDYDSLLRSNLDRLLKGQLRATWKRNGTDCRGAYILYEDKISSLPPAILGITQLDAPDNIRLVFSDAAVQQPVEVICKPITLPATLPTPGTVTWGLTIQSSILVQSVTNVWSVGDQVSIPVSQFKNGVPVGDDDQIRFLNDQPASGTGTSSGTNQFIDAVSDYVANGVELGDTLVIFSGAATGSYTITQVTTTVLTVATTIPSAISSTYVIRKGVGALQIRVEGQAAALAQHQFEVTPPNPLPTDDLTITFANSGGVFPTSGSSNLYITIHIQYGGGRGLSRRPDSIHNIVLTSQNPQFLTQLENYPAGNYQLRTAWAPLWSKFRDSTYKSLLPVTSESYADLGSKTVVLSPFQEIGFPAPTPIPGAIMPIHKLDGSTPKWTSTDPLGAFDKTQYVMLPRSLVPGWSAVQVPILPTSGTTFHRGINFGLMAQEGVVAAHSSDQQHNQWYINYSIGSTASCAIFSTINLQTSATATYNGALSYGGHVYTDLYAGARLFNDDPTVIGALPTARGLGRQGIELPPFYACARVLGVYEAQDYKVNGSAFYVESGNTRAPRGSGATNLLRQNFNGTVFFLEIDDDGDTTYIINADVVDITKSPNSISSFSSGNYVVEASIFGFDRGSFDLSQSFRLALVNSTVAPTLLNNPDGPNTILPGPLSGSDTALINYSRSPYQFDAWQTQSAGLDKGYTRGPLLSTTAYQLSSTELNAQALTRPNQKPLEVLASVGFITTLGTGRLSGDFSLANVYTLSNVGYEDPTDPLAPYPPLTSGGPRPLVKSGALGSLANYGDLEASPELLGCTERLPLGALYRDKDFHGSRFSDELSSPLVYLDTAGVGSGVAGMSASTNLDQTEVVAMPAGTSAGIPGDVLVAVDGEQSNYSALTNYRTNRGGSVFMGSGDRPGGELFATYSRLLGSGKGNRVLVGRVFLVRNAPTSVGATEVSGGDELMLAIASQVMELGTSPLEAMVLLGTNGTQEGFSAFDVCRIEGHPIITNHTFYDVNPSTIQLPLGKTIAQITAPSPSPAIPIGAASTVYASDGTRNFWTNIPTLTGLNILGNLTVSGTASVAGNLLASSNALTFTNATRIGTTNLSSGTTSSLIVSTGDGSGTASTGNLTVTPGTSSGSGAAGGLALTGGSSTGSSGNGGNVIVAGGTTFNGNGGNVTVRGGTAGVSGNGGNVIVASGLGTVTNGSVIVRIGPLVTVASFDNADLILGPTSGTNDYGIQFTAGVTNPTISQADATSGSGANLTIHSQIAGAGNNNGGHIDIVTGHGTGSGNTGVFSVSNGLRNNLRIDANDPESVFFDHNITELGDPNAVDVYSLTFSSRVLAPKIGQKPTSGDGETLTIKSADVNSLFQGKGGDLALFAGNALGDVSHPKPGGDIYLKTGKGSFDRSGQVFVQVETGTTMSPSPVTVATITQSAVIVDVNDLVFDPAVNAPLVAQQDATGADGSNLKVQAQKGDQTAGSSHSGGNLILISGAHGPSGGSNGVIEIQLGNHSYPRAIVDENGIGIAHTELAGTNCGLGLDTSSNDPPVHPGSVDTVLYVNSFGDVRSSNSRGVITLNGTVNRIVDTSSFTASPVTASSPTALMASFPTFTGVLEGDIIEGSACFHVVAAASTGNVGTIYLILKDGSTLDIYQYSFSMNAAIDTIVTIPFSYTAGPSTTATVEIRPEAASSDGTTGIYVSAIGSTGKWLFSKQTRP